MGKRRKKEGGKGSAEHLSYRDLILKCMGTKKSMSRERLRTKVMAMVLAQMGEDEVSDKKRAKLERKFSKKLTGLIQRVGCLTETDGRVEPGAGRVTWMQLRRVATLDAAAHEEAEAAKERATGSGMEEEEQQEEGDVPVPSKGHRGPWYNHADASVERKMGKFSDEEKAKVMAAMEKELVSHGREKDDYTWLFKTKNKTQGQKTKSGNQYLQFWTAVGAAFRDRTPDQIYQFAKKHCLHLNNAHTWTDDDRAELIALVQEHGPKWTKIGDLMGLTQYQVKNAYTLLNQGKKRNTGLWSEAEHAQFEKAVERSLAHAKPTTTNNTSSDNISWVAVSQLVGTRSATQCMTHWQNSRGKGGVRGKTMEARGIWADGDDEILVSAIEEAGATEECDVQWESLMSGREGPVVKRQWHLLVKKVPQWWNKSFAERLEALSAKMLNGVKAVEREEDEDEKEDA